MKTTRKDGIESDAAIQNRFTAYLKVSISHLKAKYLSGLHERQTLELSYEERTELLNQIQNCHEDTYFSEEIEDKQLSHALDKLKERERLIVFRRAVFEESFIKIAKDSGIRHGQSYL